MNKVLKRQIKKTIKSDKGVSDDLKKLFFLISQTYDDFDEDRELIERSLDISSKELVAKNEELREKSQSREQVFNNLTKMIKDFGEEFDIKVPEQGDAKYLISSLNNIFKEINENRNRIKSQEERFKSLYAISANTDLTVDEQFDKAIEQIGKIFELDTGMITKVERDKFLVLNVFSSTGKIKKNDLISKELLYCDQVVKTQHILSISDAAITEFKRHQCFIKLKITSYIGAPIFVNNRLYGIISFSSSIAKNPEFDPSDEYFVNLVAKWVGSVIETEQNQKEIYRLAQFPRLNPNPIIEINDEKLVFVNKGALDIVGTEFTKTGQPKSKNYKKILELIKNGITAERNIFESEFELGDKFYGAYIVSNNESKSIIVYLFDITKLKKTEENLRKRKEDLEKFNKLMIGRELRIVELKKQLKK